MALTYIQPGSYCTAEKLNDLFEEANRRMEVVLHGKTPLLTFPGRITGTGAVQAPFGRFFWFVTPPYPISGRLATSGSWSATTPVFTYNHQSYVTAAQNAQTLSVNLPRRTIIVSQTTPMLYGSLQVHTREHNGVVCFMQQAGAEPEQVSQWGVAEIVMEGDGFQTFTFDDSWNKYNFLRFHNLNPYTTTVEFGSPAKHTIQIPPWGCRTVRRDSVDGPYENGHGMFFKVRTGDPRSWSAGVWMADPYPTASMYGNNVLNPWHVAWWIKHLERGWRRGVNWVFKAFLDGNEVWDAGPSNREHFTALDENGQPRNTALFADMLICSGVVDLISKSTGERQRINYSSLSELAAQGVQFIIETPPAKQYWNGTTYVSYSMPGGITKMSKPDTDVVAANNLLAEYRHARAGSGWCADVSNGVYLFLYQPEYIAMSDDATMRNVATPHNTAMHLVASTTNRPFDTRDWQTLNTIVNNKNESLVEQQGSMASAPIVAHLTTVADMLTLKHASSSTSPPASNAASFSATLRMGPRGPVLSWTGAYAVGAPGAFLRAYGSTWNNSLAREVVNGGREYGFAGWMPFYSGNGLYVNTPYPTNVPSDDYGLVWCAPRQPLQWGRMRFVDRYLSSGVWYNIYSNPFVAGSELEHAGEPFFAFVPRDHHAAPAERSTVMARNLHPVMVGLGAPFQYLECPFAVWPVARNPDCWAEYEASYSPAWWLANRTRMMQDDFYQSDQIATLWWMEWCVHFPMVAEHYNWLAMHVNQLKTAYQLNWMCLSTYTTTGGNHHVAWPLVPAEDAYADSVMGPFMSQFKPRDQFVAWFDADATKKAATYTNFGVPVRTENDLPASYFAFKNDTTNQRVTIRCATGGVITRQSGGTMDIQVTSLSATITATQNTAKTWWSNNNVAAVFDLTTADVNSMADYRWVKISDVKARAEALGFIFDYVDAVEPCVLVKHEIVGCAIAAASRAVGETALFQAPYVYVWNGTQFVPSSVWDVFTDYWEHQFDAVGWRFVPVSDANSEWVRAVVKHTTAGRTIYRNYNSGVNCRVCKDFYPDLITVRGNSCSDPSWETWVQNSAKQALDVASGGQYVPLGARAPVVYMISLDYGAYTPELRRVLFGETLLRPTLCNLPVAAWATRLLVRDCTTGPRSWLVRVPAPLLQWRANFSGTGYPQAKSRFLNGADVIPLDGVAAGLPGVSASQLTSDTALVVPGDGECFDPFLVRGMVDASNT